MMKIPGITSTQHPDDVQLPFFANGQGLSGDDEVQEACYAYSHLGCDEQLWDCEGKEADDFVVRKPLTKYEHFFKQRRLGEDPRLALRIPNPDVEKNEAKVLVETPESIPRSCDATGSFYEREAPPIHEVILPITMSAESLSRVSCHYGDFVVGKKSQPFSPGDITDTERVGDFTPKKISEDADDPAGGGEGPAPARWGRACGE